jgi:hypothetical protein
VLVDRVRNGVRDPQDDDVGIKPGEIVDDRQPRNGFSGRTKAGVSSNSFPHSIVATDACGDRSGCRHKPTPRYEIGATNRRDKRVGSEKRVGSSAYKGAAP